MLLDIVSSMWQIGQAVLHTGQVTCGVAIGCQSLLLESGVLYWALKGQLTGCSGRLALQSESRVVCWFCLGTLMYLEHCLEHHSTGHERL